MAKSVVVIGGGLAGLAAAAGLASHGFRVTVLESRPRLGGRATSVVDNTTGELIDNCQHVSMGCCTHFAHFCKLIEIDQHFVTEDELVFIDRNNRHSRLANRFGPAPFHLFHAFRKLKFLSLAEKKQLAFGLKKLSALLPKDISSNQSFGDWLVANGQSEGVIRKYWHTVLVSALSESLDRIDVGVARKVFVDGFLTHRDAWKISLATVPLGELYGENLIEWFQRRDGSIRTKAGVEKLSVENDKVCSIELRNGETLEADHFVLAVPWHLVGKLLPESIRENDCYRQVDQIEAAPISSAHLWLDREFTPMRHAVFVDRLSQWMFNRTAIHKLDSNQNRDLYYYQIVISNSRDLAGMPQTEIIDRIMDDLAEIWPEVKNAKLLNSRIITEHKAVFSPTPGIERNRPAQQTPISNLQIAGDWTQTGWPATMEGAVRSGFLAAENVLHSDGMKGQLLQPDLPVTPMSNWLLSAFLNWKQT